MIRTTSRPASIRFLLLALGGAAFLGACASSDTNGGQSGGAGADAAQADDALGDSPSDAPAEARGDARDSGAVDDAGDSARDADDGAVGDAPEGDASDSSGTFACGAERCGPSFQFCHRATSPGTCPAPRDGGPCPAGCPGCGPLPLTCDPMPADCFAFPSCECITSKTCGSARGGDCTEVDGGYTVGCRGV